MQSTLVTAGSWVADSEGVYGFTIANIQGLSDGVGVKRDEIRREGRHGSFDTPVYLDSRVVSVSGKCWGRSAEDLHQYGVIFRGLGASGDRFRVTFRHNGQTVWAWARRGSQPSFEDRPALRVADWQYDFWMPDPYLYGEARTFVSTGTDVHVSHRGNTRAFGVVTVTGSDPLGYRIAHPGGSYRVTAPLVSGQTDVIDFRRGSYTKNGTVMDTSMSDVDRFTVAGGARVPFRVEPITAGRTLTATLTLTDTFV